MSDPRRQPIPPGHNDVRASRHPAQFAVMVAAGVFALLGVLGFVPGVTANYQLLSFAGPVPAAMLFGVFAVSVLHNVIHLGLAWLAWIARSSAQRARLYLILGGCVYLVLALYGALITEDTSSNVIALNTADNWLHAGMGVAILGCGILLAWVRTPVRPLR